MKPKFDAVLSLGGLCQTAFQIECHFGFRIHSPFDWLVTPLESIAKVFEDDGASFGKNITVGLQTVDNIPAQVAICRKYAVAYRHEYPRDDVYDLILSPSALQNTIDKLSTKHSKFTRLLDGRYKVLFVRMGGHMDKAMADPDFKDGRPTTVSDLNRLCATIQKRFPSLDFEIAFLYIEGVTQFELTSEPLDQRITPFLLTEYIGAGWMGKSEVWGDVFSKYNIDISSEIPLARQFYGSKADYEALL